MLSRLLNCLLIYITLVLDGMPRLIENVTLLMIAGLVVSCALTPSFIVRTIQQNQFSKRMVSVAELEPASYGYGQRVLLARLVSLVLFLHFAWGGSVLWTGLVCLEYLLLEYYIYQIRLYSSVCLDLLENKFRS